MRHNKLFSKKTIHAYIITLSITFIVIIVALLMFKYHIEGEKNLPFNLEELSVISTANTQNSKEEGNTWHVEISQKNDIYFYIQKNSNYKKEDTIKKIIFDQFVIKKENELRRNPNI